MIKVKLIYSILQAINQLVKIKIFVLRCQQHRRDKYPLIFYNQLRMYTTANGQIILEKKSIIVDFLAVF